MAPIPNRNILVLATAAVAGLFFAFHGFVEPPWDLLAAGASFVALGTWAVAPCALAAAATLVGRVDLSAGRTNELPEWLCQGLTVLLPMMALAVLAGLREPVPFRSSSWIAELFPIAVAVGIGLALCALFWQGVVQLRLGDNMAPVFRAVMVTALATALWLPFWFQSAAPTDGFALWTDLVIVTAVAATLCELGNSTRLVVILTAMTGAAAVYVHHIPFL